MKKSYSIQDFLEVKSAMNPSFSPDGSKVAYLSNESGTQQVYLVPTAGGNAEQLTDYPDAIVFARFSPTEDNILFGKSDGGNEQTQFFLLNLDTREVTDLTQRPDVRHDFGRWSPDGKQICFSSTERNGTDFDVYVMDINTRVKRCVFDGGGWCQAAGFSPRGTYVLAAQDHSNTNTDLYLCNLKTGEVEHITPHTGSVRYENPRWLPDESVFYVIQNEGREFMNLSRYDLGTKQFEYVISPDWDIENIMLNRAGTAMFVTVNEDGYISPRLHDAKTLEKRSCSFPTGNVYGGDFSPDDSLMALVVGDSRTTLNIWILDVATGASHKLTDSTQGVPVEVMVEPELIRFESFDGLSVPAFVYRPKDVAPGSKLPVIMSIHGGPEAQYQPALVPLTQYFVQSGYIVVAPNVRGSSGYGKTYLSLDDVEKRLDSVKDMVALREHLETFEDVDSSKVVLMGGSYGGYMVLAGLAFYPKLWAAGVDTVGIVNFVTFLENTAVYRRALREAEYGSLEHDRELLEYISPIRAINDIEAPLFVIHGANDSRVPLSEAEQVVARLTELGREVQLLVYHDEGHGLVKLRNKLDAYPKVAAFLDRVLQTAQTSS